MSRLARFAAAFGAALLAVGATRASGAAMEFHTLAPCRLFDSRSGTGTPLSVGGSFTLPAWGHCSIPFSAKAISANVTVTLPTSGGSLRLFAFGTPPPNTSAISYAAGQTRANNASVQLDPTIGAFVITTTQPSGTVHVIIDVNGYFDDAEIVYVQVFQTSVGVGNNCFSFDSAFDIPAGNSEPPGPAPSGAWKLTGVQPKGGYTTWVRALQLKFDSFSGLLKWFDVTDVATWSVQDPGGTGTTVGVSGRVTTGANVGTVRFIAQLPSGARSSPLVGTPFLNGELTVVDASLTGLTVDPQNVSNTSDPHFGPDPVYLAIGRTQPLKVTGTFGGPGAGGYCISWDATYMSSQPSRVLVDSAGVLTAQPSAGPAVVTAKRGVSISDAIAVNIGPAEIAYVEILPSAAALPVDTGASAQLSAFAHYTSGATVEETLSPFVTWAVESLSPVMAVNATGLVHNVSGLTGDSNEVGACFPSPYISPAGVTATLVACSDSGNAAQTAPPYLGADRLPVDLNSVVTVQ